MKSSVTVSLRDFAWLLAVMKHQGDNPKDIREAVFQWIFDSLGIDPTEDVRDIEEIYFGGGTSEEFPMEACFTALGVLTDKLNDDDEANYTLGCILDCARSIQRNLKS
jgi:hypothetical protein